MTHVDERIRRGGAREQLDVVSIREDERPIGAGGEGVRLARERIHRDQGRIQPGGGRIQAAGGGSRAADDGSASSDYNRVMSSTPLLQFIEAELVPADS